MKRLSSLLIFLLGVVLLPAKDFTVNITADVPDASPGDGVCLSLGRDPGCSLRAAIQEANAWPGADTIIVPVGTFALTIAGVGENDAATGDLDIRDTVDLMGAGPSVTIIDGGRLDRVFEIGPDASATICNVTIHNGATLEQGGGINVLNGSRLTLANSIVANNSSTSGGGIWSIGDVQIILSNITGNSVAACSFGCSGGGILAGGTTGRMQIRNSTINGNTGTGNGAGVFNAAILTIVDSIISNNAGVGDNAIGGGLGNSAAGNATLTNSIISGNASWGIGAGILNTGSLTLTNSTISGNQSGPPGGCTLTCGGGGGIFNTPAGSVNAINTTITANAAVAGGGIDNRGSASFRNTIVAKNPFGGDCGTDDLSVPIVSQGRNLESDGTCGFAGPGDQNTDPLLGPLANNGGFTDTHKLLAGSPAINAANNCPITDQRHFARNAACDIGAYEVGFSPELALTKTVDCEHVKVGSKVGFHLVATNFGPRGNPGVRVFDVLPAGLQFVSARSSQGACRILGPAPVTGGTLIGCELATVAPDSSVGITIEALAVVPGALVNAGLVISPVPDTNLTNNIATATVHVSPVER